MNILAWLEELFARPVELAPTAGPQPGLAQRALEIAQVEYALWKAAKGDKGAEGLLLDKYLLEQAPAGTRANWCALFVSYCLVTAARELGRADLTLTLSQRGGAKRLGRELAKSWGGKWVNVKAGQDPKAGDIAVYHRGVRISGAWTWQGHIRFVSAVQEDGKRYVGIGGNEGGMIRSRVHRISDERLVGYLRL